MLLTHTFQPFTAGCQSVLQYLTAHPILQYAIVTAFVAWAGLLIISAPRKKKTKTANTPFARTHNALPSSKDMSAIAGEDVVTTQLDLAKAYIEMGKKDQAKRILNQTLNAGNHAQKIAAKYLLETLSA